MCLGCGKTYHDSCANRDWKENVRKLDKSWLLRDECEIDYITSENGDASDKQVITIQRILIREILEKNKILARMNDLLEEKVENMKKIEKQVQRLSQNNSRWKFKQKNDDVVVIIDNTKQEKKTENNDIVNMKPQKSQTAVSGTEIRETGNLNTAEQKNGASNSTNDDPQKNDVTAEGAVSMNQILTTENPGDRTPESSQIHKRTADELTSNNQQKHASHLISTNKFQNANFSRGLDNTTQQNLDERTL